MKKTTYPQTHSGTFTHELRPGSTTGPEARCNLWRLRNNVPGAVWELLTSAIDRGAALDYGFTATQYETACGRGPVTVPRFTPPTISTDELTKNHDSRVKGRARIEVAICRRLLLDLSRWGCWVAIDDGDDELQQITSGDEALRIIFSVDTCRLYIDDKCTPNDASQCIFLVLGNDGYDVISDYHNSLDPLLGEIFDWIEEAEAKGLCPECEPPDLSTVRTAYDAKDPRTFMRAALAVLDQPAVRNVRAPAAGDINQARAWIQQALALADKAEAIAAELEALAPEPRRDDSDGRDERRQMGITY